MIQKTDTDTTESLAILMIDLFASAALSDGTIPRICVWERILSAMMSSAAAADTYGDLVERIFDKLQLSTLYMNDNLQIKEIRDTLRERSAWPEFRQLLETQTRYLVGMTRAARDERRAAS
jgi:glutaredoxin-related protein